MTEVAFHFNAPQKVAYACKLLRKASAAGAQVAVVGEGDTLARLDVELWAFSALDFVAHCNSGDDAALLAHSPVMLCAQAADAPHHQVLVNLGQGMPAGFERFDRVIEVVTHDEADRQAARVRWKHYTERGYTMVRHDLAQAA
jgi:DNA polymerase III subunit chi